MAAVLVLGTRPEIVKLGPVIGALAARDVDFSVVHTGQHYDTEMSDSFLATFGVEIGTQLELGGTTRGIQIGQMTEHLSALFERDTPGVVVVQGDTNSALAGGLAANATDAPLLHVEAGLRSFDRRMPEEHNRVAIDVLSDYCAAPTATAAANLADAAIEASRVFVTGNTVLDAISTILASGPDRADELMGFAPQGYVLATIHRPENTDDPSRLAAIVSTLASCPLPVVFPLHPRTARAIESAGLTDVLRDSVHVVQPLPYDRFLQLLASSAFAISDSGGIQEEVTAFGVPVVVVRDSTERPEVLGTFAELVSGADTDGLGRAVERLSDGHGERRRNLAGLASPYAAPDGRPPSEHIADLIVSALTS